MPNTLIYLRTRFYSHIFKLVLRSRLIMARIGSCAKCINSFRIVYVYALSLSLSLSVYRFNKMNTIFKVSRSLLSASRASTRIMTLYKCFYYFYY